MKILLSILKSANVLNLALASTAAVLAFFLMQSYFGGPWAPAMDLDLPRADTAPAARDFRALRGELPSYLDFADLSEKSIFHPERKVLKGDVALQHRPEILLYGTLVTDEVRLAYLEDRHTPLTTPGRGKRQLIVKQGGMVSGYLLKEVNTNNIVLVRGEDRITVSVCDERKLRGSDGAGAPASEKKSQAARAGRIPAGRNMNTAEPGLTGPALYH